jgi:FAD:protein FMN transferase
MKQTRVMMGMPITIEIADAPASEAIFNEVFDYFAHIDERDNRDQ